MVSAVVDLAARRTSQAARASAEAETLSTLAGDVLRGEPALPALLDRVRETFGMTSATLLERGPRGRCGREGAGRRRSTGAARLARGGDVGVRPVRAAGGGRRRGAGRGGPRAGAARPAPARRGPPGAGRVRRRRPRSRSGSTGWPRRSPRPSRSPRSTAPGPRCSPRSATTCARRWPRRRPPSRRCAARTCRGARRSAAELLATADESLDRLTRLVENLLDMSRLQAGALAVSPHPVGLDDVLPAGARRARRGRPPRRAASCRSTCPRCSPTRTCWSGSWPT